MTETPTDTVPVLPVLPAAIRLRLLSLVTGRSRDERGDVPGWVMVTVMTAMLVVAIGALAEDELSMLLSNALRSVTG